MWVLALLVMTTGIFFTFHTGLVLGAVIASISLVLALVIRAICGVKTRKLMRDYNYIDEFGNRIPVSKMDTKTIHQILNEGMEIHNTDGEIDPTPCVIERLQLELFIRALGLR